MTFVQSEESPWVLRAVIVLAAICTPRHDLDGNLGLRNGRKMPPIVRLANCWQRAIRVS